jgi:hypothetical protein
MTDTELGNDGVLMAYAVNSRIGRQAVHGSIQLGDYAYEFTTGGAGRGPAPFGDYHIGGREYHPRLHGSCFPLSDKRDPLLGGVWRSALFIHRGPTGPGGRSLGCFHIAPDRFRQFEHDLMAGGYHTLRFIGPDTEGIA